MVTDSQGNMQPPGSARIAARLLLVDDDELTQELAQLIVEDAGLAMVPAMTGQNAVDLASSEGFDLILMDLQLPDFDGCEAARRIRQLSPRGVRPSIVALTGTLRAGDRERCRQAGMDGCEAKPLTPKLLDRLLAEHLPSCPSSMPSESHQLSAARLDQLFRESAARLVADLHNARAAGDRGAVLRAAHTLKSVSGHVGIAPLIEACAILESAARDGAEALDPAIEAVQAAYASIDPGPENSAAQPAPATAVEPVGPLVLVVDDEENERFLVRRTLEHAGYRVGECDCGEAAIDFCRIQLPDAILLDGLMPGMDGLAACRLLRQEFPPNALPILMYTGLCDPAWRAQAIQAGADRVVDKSVGIERLASNLTAALAACGLKGAR